MGAVIGVGLAGLFGLMGLVALVTWIDSATKANPIQSRGDRETPSAIDRPDFKDGVDAIKENIEEKNQAEIEKAHENEEIAINNGETSAAPDEFIDEPGITDVHPFNNEEVIKGYNTWGEFKSAAAKVAPLGYTQLKEMLEKWMILHPPTVGENVTDIPHVSEGSSDGVVSGEGSSDGVVSGEGSSDGVVIGEDKKDGILAGEKGKPTGSGGTVVVPGQKTEIKDGTNDGLEEFIDGIDMQSVLDLIDKNHREQRAYEEKIRKETQEREDNAYQRAVADMRKAGINPNLVNLVQSASGGGIVQPTPKDYTLWQTEINKTLSMIQQQIELNFKGEQADKDRLVKAITSMMGLVAIGARMK